MTTSEKQAERWRIWICRNCGQPDDGTFSCCPNSEIARVEVVPAPLLDKALEYVAHQSWRCEYPDRYPWEPDCPCGLTAVQRQFGDGEATCP